VLGNPDKADIAVDNCLFSASNHVTAFYREGAFRSWLVRIAIDEALAILHGSSIREHRRDWSLQEAAQRC
jgi:DNA-directed RNA polymerase specialized sigma24 family protein